MRTAKPLVGAFVLSSVVFAGVYGQAQTRRMPTPGASGGERRVALVIGNDAYRHATPLKNAVSDAGAVAKELEGAGFEVVLRKDVGRREMNRAVDEFVGRLSRGAVAVLYYSGHGMQIQNTNYLIPVDLNAEGPQDVADDALEVTKVLTRITEAGPAFSLAILDACRNNPYGASGRSFGKARGLTAPTSTPTGFMIVYSAGANEEALDRLGGSDKEPNGLFTRELLKVIREPGLTIQAAVSKVKYTVIAKAKGVGHEQHPAVYDQSTGEFRFREAVEVPPAKEAEAGKPGGLSADALVYEAWGAIKESRDPADFRGFLAMNPPSALKFAAEAKLKQLTVAPTAVATVASPTAVKVVEARPAPATRPPELAGGGSAWEGKQHRNTLGMEFVRIEPGTFEMGSPEGEEEGVWEEKKHLVKLSKGYWLGKYEVTQGEWELVMGENPSHFKDCGKDCPVENVSWNDVQGFLRKLNEREGGGGYRLPTEAEWEMGARGGTKGARHGKLGEIAWHQGNSGEKTHPVGKKVPNAFGLHDMIGNVQEWVSDRTGEYPGSTQVDPAGSTEGSDRVLRGGSFFWAAMNCRSGVRHGHDPAARLDDLGFRLARGQ